MQNRVDAFSFSGGDTVQMLKTKEYLEKQGVVVETSLKCAPDLANYDLVHLFNVTRVHDTYHQYINAKKQNKPIVISSIYANFDELDFKGSFGVKKILWQKLSKNNRELLKTLVRAIRHPIQFQATRLQLMVGFTEQQKQVIAGSNIVLPNSYLEMEAIRRDFNIDFEYEIVPNAVEHVFANKDGSFVNKTGWNNYILCVGNYVERKNQPALLQAMAGLDLSLIFVGGEVRSHARYYQKMCGIAKELGGRVKIMSKVSQKELIPIYSGAKVVILPSWIESTGLACLEGALAGANIVITNRGYAKEYFRDMAYYCDPDNIDSIRSAVLAAYKAPVNPDLKAHILNNYTWDKAAEATLKAYKRVLGI